MYYDSDDEYDEGYDHDHDRAYDDDDDDNDDGGGGDDDNHATTVVLYRHYCGRPALREI